MPLTFEIYRQGRRLTDYAVRGAFATGPESTPTGGRVWFEEGLLHVEAGGPDEPPPPGGVFSTAGVEAATGCALLWDAGDVGRYVLETTRLPPRPRPYVLNVELARHRLMRLVHKQEDWNLWDQPAASAALDKVRRAQVTFAEALGLLHEPARAAELADAVLREAIEAGEELSILHAEMLLLRRRPHLGKVTLGTRIDTPNRNARYRTTAARYFDFVSVPMPWRHLQPEEDAFATEPTDNVVEFFARNRVPVVAGPLVDLSDDHVPHWLYIYENDFDSLRDLAFEYVRSIAQRYRRVVRVWNVVAGLHAASGFGLSFEQVIELTRLLTGQVKAVNPTARTVVTVRQPFGEYLAAPAGTPAGVPPLLYAEMVSQSGVECDGFGLELLTGSPRLGMQTRDLFQISALLDRFAQLGRPLFVTLCGCPGRPQADAATPSDATDGGRWHAPWTPERQARWLRCVYRVALSKPFVESVTWADLTDGPNNVLPAGGLLDDMFRPKNAFLHLQDLRRLLRPPPPGTPAPAAAGAPGLASAPPPPPPTA